MSASVDVRLCVVGGGRMGSALVAGLLSGGWGVPGEIAVAERAAEAREVLRGRFPGLVVGEPVAADGLLVAVKPQDAEAVCRQLGGLRYRHALSIAAGITTASLSEWFGGNVAVVRAMPNTPAQLGAGVSVIAGGADATEADLVWAEGILAVVGTVVRLPEELIDAATGISGCGPAYLYYLAEALIAAGVAAGLDGAVARQLVDQTLYGAARMIVDTGRPADVLRAEVASPGGSTEAAINVLETRQVGAAFVAAVAAAVRRTGELGGGRRTPRQTPG
ncbi:MAG: pyrroline-5-carboxylate reductase [Acidimicrobiales bacterium]